MLVNQKRLDKLRKTEIVYTLTPLSYDRGVNCDSWVSS